MRPWDVMILSSLALVLAGVILALFALVKRPLPVAAAIAAPVRTEITRDEGVKLIEGPNEKIDDRGTWNPGSSSWCIWLWRVGANRFLLSTYDDEAQRWYLYTDERAARAGADRFLTESHRRYSKASGGVE